jgi:tetratricopeptide (TPR) repeat protein
MAAIINIQEGSSIILGEVSLLEDQEYSLSPPDIFQLEECDSGPRLVKAPILVDVTSTHNPVLLKTAILHNKGLIHHLQGRLQEAKLLYELVVFTLQSSFQSIEQAHSTVLCELAMSSYNNLGVLSYFEQEESFAAAHFELALRFAKQLSSLSNRHRLNFANILNNRCRVSWIQGDVSNVLYVNLLDIFQIRSTILPWYHPDVAASMYNIAVSEYNLHDAKKAKHHFLQYLAICDYRSKKLKIQDLDKIPALIFLLLIRSEDKGDQKSRELVRGLRILQEMRHDEGPNSPDLATVLNFVGSMLFHQKDYKNALVFFLEELRLEEENSSLDEDTTSVSVTCNNIGRIMQELGQLEDAIRYYERALKTDLDFSLLASTLSSSSRNSVFTRDSFRDTLCTQKPPSINLFSTIWYNLGLIYDQLGHFSDAISAFEMSLELRRGMLGSNHPDVACLLYNIGILKMEQNCLKDASLAFKEVFRIRDTGVLGHLNDSQVIKTLEKLATMLKADGDTDGALEVAQEILSIQKTSVDFDAITRGTAIGLTLRSISELYHAKDELGIAATMALESFSELSEVAQLKWKFVPREGAEGMNMLEYIGNLEQSVSSLLLLGSLYHEMTECTKAEVVLRKASFIVERAIAIAERFPCSRRPPSLLALREVVLMMASVHCAAVA